MNINESVSDTRIYFCSPTVTCCLSVFSDINYIAFVLFFYVLYYVVVWYDKEKIDKEWHDNLGTAKK